MEKGKRKPIPILKHYRVLIILVAVVVLIGVYVLVSAHTEKSCVTQMEPGDSNSRQVIGQEERCFNTQAEAIAYATNGEVVLPANASSIEIGDALNKFYSSH